MVDEIDEQLAETSKTYRTSKLDRKWRVHEAMSFYVCIRVYKGGGFRLLGEMERKECTTGYRIEMKNK
jgi:hypothetical protein